MELLQVSLSDLRNFDDAEAPIMFFDNHELCQYANPSSGKWFGKDSAEWSGMVFLRDLIGDSNYLSNHEKIQSGLCGVQQNLDIRLPLENGRTKDGMLTLLPYNLNKSTIGFFLYLTELKKPKGLQTEKSLFDAKASGLFEIFLENTPIPAWIVDEDGTIHYLNAAYFKVRPFMKVGKSLFKSLPQALAETYLKENREVLLTLKTLSVIEKAPDPQGKIRTFKIVKFPIMYKERYMVGGYALDITEQVASPEVFT